MPLSMNDLSAFARTSVSIPSHESEDDVPPESVHETAPCPTDLELCGVLKGEEDWVRRSRGLESRCLRWSRWLWRIVTSMDLDGFPHRGGQHASAIKDDGPRGSLPRIASAIPTTLGFNNSKTCNWVWGNTEYLAYKRCGVLMRSQNRGQTKKNGDRK